MTAPVVIAGCGARKLGNAAPAAAMYTGPYARACIATAAAIAAPGRAFILSARYGLLGLADVIEPYDLTMGQPGAITARQLADQAAALGITGAPVVALCPARYAAMLRAVWADVKAPLAGLGIGRQRAALAALRAALVSARPLVGG